MSESESVSDLELNEKQSPSSEVNQLFFEESWSSILKGFQHNGTSIEKIVVSEKYYLIIKFSARIETNRTVAMLDIACTRIQISVVNA